MSPGNDGMRLDGLDLINIGISEHSKLIDFAKANDVAWTFIGPDDALRQVSWMISMQLVSRHLVRPRLQLSWSGLRILLKKSWSSTTFRQRPMELFRLRGSQGLYRGRKALNRRQGRRIGPLGKVSSLRETVEQAVEAAHEMLLDNKFGDSGARVVIEEFLDGEEFLSLPLSMGTSSTSCQQRRTTNVPTMVTRVPNTGGMGAYAPVPHLPQSVVDTAVDTIVKPVLEGMIKEGRPYLGVLSRANFDS